MLRLDAADRAALARAMAEQRLVDVPWVLFFHASYEFAHAAYEYANASTAERRSERHLNDSASLMTGLQTRVTPTDPGYFFGASFIYSAVFRDASEVAGSAAAPPAKVRGNTVRFEVRRLVAGARVGINPSYAHDLSSRTTTIDASAYLRARGAVGRAGANFYGGVRAGYRTGEGGAFVSVFGGALFKTTGRAAIASRD